MDIKGFTFTNETKNAAIQSLALALEREEMKWLNVPVATSELVAYEAKLSTITGRISYNAPEGMHDDTVIARALMNHARQSGVPTVMPFGAEQRDSWAIR